MLVLHSQSVKLQVQILVVSTNNCKCGLMSTKPKRRAKSCFYNSSHMALLVVMLT